jgi:hypothetical protein
MGCNSTTDWFRSKCSKENDGFIEDIGRALEHV